MQTDTTDLVVITGFLGSGKTTLLNRLIPACRGRTLGVIVNDFGQIGVDRDLVLGANPGLAAGSAVMEITGGSIFCSCLESAFLDGLLYYAHNPPQLLLVETSGLTDPARLPGLLARDPRVAARFRLAALVCVLDVSTVLDLIDVVEAAGRQIREATLLVLNKIDLVEGPGRERIARRLRELNPWAPLVETSYGSLEGGLLELACGSAAAAGRAARDESAAIGARPGAGAPGVAARAAAAAASVPGDRPATLLLDQQELDLQTLRAFLEAVAPYVLRLKGFYRIGGRTYLIGADQGGISFEPYERPVSRLGVSIICSPEQRQRVYEAWRRALGRPA